MSFSNQSSSSSSNTCLSNTKQQPEPSSTIIHKIPPPSRILGISSFDVTTFQAAGKNIHELHHSSSLTTTAQQGNQPYIVHHSVLGPIPLFTTSTIAQQRQETTTTATANRLTQNNNRAATVSNHQVPKRLLRGDGFLVPFSSLAFPTQPPPPPPSSSSSLLQENEHHDNHQNTKNDIPSQEQTITHNDNIHQNQKHNTNNRNHQIMHIPPILGTIQIKANRGATIRDLYNLESFSSIKIGMLPMSHERHFIDEKWLPPDDQDDDDDDDDDDECVGVWRYKIILLPTDCTNTVSHDHDDDDVVEIIEDSAQEGDKRHQETNSNNKHQNKNCSTYGWISDRARYSNDAYTIAKVISRNRPTKTISIT